MGKLAEKIGVVKGEFSVEQTVAEALYVTMSFEERNKEFENGFNVEDVMAWDWEVKVRGDLKPFFKETLVVWKILTNKNIATERELLLLDKYIEEQKYSKEVALKYSNI